MISPLMIVPQHFKGDHGKSGGGPTSRYERLIFHPMERFQEDYSDEKSDCMSTYMWVKFRLIAKLSAVLRVREASAPNMQVQLYHIIIMLVY